MQWADSSNVALCGHGNRLTSDSLFMTCCNYSSLAGSPKAGAHVSFFHSNSLLSKLRSLILFCWLVAWSQRTQTGMRNDYSSRGWVLACYFCPLLPLSILSAEIEAAGQLGWNHIHLWLCVWHPWGQPDFFSWTFKESANFSLWMAKFHVQLPWLYRAYTVLSFVTPEAMLHRDQGPYAKAVDTSLIAFIFHPPLSWKYRHAWNALRTIRSA